MTRDQWKRAAARLECQRLSDEARAGHAFCQLAILVFGLITLICLAGP